MEWRLQVDGYCERLGPEFWAEPVNALTNLAFLIAAAVMWPRAAGLGRGLCVILGSIGIGSFLFHTYAERWAGLADVLPILIFILLYLYAANRDMLGLTRGRALGVTALFLPYAALTGLLFARVPGLGGSAGYAPVPILILIYAGILRRRAVRTAAGLAIGAALLLVSLTARTVDMPLCTVWPLGTHFLWHLLNAVMLGWMIEVHRRHLLAGRAAGR